MDEILLGDSDDEISHTPSSRKNPKGTRKRKMNKAASVTDEFVEEPPISRRTRSRSSSKTKLSPTTPTRKEKINEEKVKKILSKVFKTNSTPVPAPTLEKSSALKVRGKENAMETQSAVGKPTRSVSDLSTPPPRATSTKKRKLTDNWKKAQAEMSPRKKFVTLDDTDDDDFVDEKKLKEKRTKKTKGKKVNDSFDIDAIFKSDDDTIDATDADTTIEIDEDFENDLEQINVLKMLFNAQVKPKGSNSEKIKRGRSSEISKSITKKKEKPRKEIQPARIIQRGPMDCFDDLITETTRGFPCNFCSGNRIKLQKRREMIHHLQSEHSERLSEEQKNIELAGLFRCDDCELIVRSRFLLRTHSKAHAKIKQDSDGCDNYYRFYMEIKQT